MKKKLSKILGVGLTLALLCSLLLTAAPVSAVTVPAVILAAGPGGPTVDPAGVISKQNVYSITFTTAAQIPVTGEIVIVFPATTNITGMVAADVIIETTAGLGGTAITSPARAVDTVAVTGTYPAAQTLTITPSDGTANSDIIGTGAIVQLTIGGATGAYVTNPPTIASYTLTVATQTGATPPVAIEAAVTTPAYSITAPVVPTLPGVVKYYNSAAVLMGSFTGGGAIQSAVTNCPTGGNVEVGPGLYTEPNLTTAVANVIIKATGTAAETTVLGRFVINHASITIDGFTITPVAANTTIGAGGNLATFQNNIFTKRGLATTTVSEALFTYNNTVALGTGTITGNTFDTSLGTINDTGIVVNQPGLTISNNTFTVDGIVGGAQDSAINVAGTGATTISGNTITGVSGQGVTLASAGVVTATSNTFSNLNAAFNITTGTVTIDGNTIDVCGVVATTVPVFAGQAAIVVNSTAGLTIKNNTITNSPNDIIEVTANSNLVNMMFNNLTGNTLGVDNNDTAANTLNATHNWWGAATGPAAGTNVPLSAIAGMINATAYLGGEATGTFTNTVGATSLLTQTTVGVDVTVNAALTAGDIIGVANYSANPQDATLLPALDGGFYDVHVVEDGVALPITSVLIKFYNANITANTVVHVWGTVAGGWVPVVAVSGVNLYEGYAYATILTTGTTPTIAGLAGTPFALVGAPLAALTTPEIMSPDPGERDIPLTPTFAWTQIAAADAYYFELADNANFVLPMVKLDGDLGRLIVTAYAYVGELSYSSAYYWRVKTVSGTIEAGNLAESPWATGVFITMDEPEEPTPPIVIEDVPTPVIEQPDIIIESPDIIVPLPAETPITPTWIYAIIGVGAVLVIAVIVLIVRTRRVA